MELARIPRLLCEFFLALLACTYGHRRGRRSSAEFWYFPYVSEKPLSYHCQAHFSQKYSKSFKYI